MTSTEHLAQKNQQFKSTRMNSEAVAGRGRKTNDRMKNSLRNFTDCAIPGSYFFDQYHFGTFQDTNSLDSKIA